MSKSKAEEFYLKASQVHHKSYLIRLQNCIPTMENRAAIGDFHCDFALDHFKGIPPNFFVKFFEDQGFTCSEEKITDPDDPYYERGTKVLRIFWSNPKQEDPPDSWRRDLS